MTLWLLVLVPLAAAIVAILMPRASTAIGAGALAAVAAVGLWAAAIEATSSMSWGPQLELTLAASGFARIMAVLVPVIALPIVLYAASTETIGRARLVALLVAFVGAMELLVLAADLLALLIGWELVGALSWVLIGHDWKESSNTQKASHAFITTRFGDLGLYVAAGIVFASTGSFAFSAIASTEQAQLAVVAAGILVAAAAKSAQVPFSPWLFSAMAGPTPVSALLHSSTMVASGAYLLIRLSPQLESVVWFAPATIAIGLTSALAGSVIAVVHRHPKRLLAASTTAQYGLMFVAIGVGSIVAAGAQLVTHAAFKSLLFLSAGTAMHAAQSDDLADMRVGRRLPATAVFAAIGALALAALPPLGGAWSKEQIAGAAFESSALLGTAVLVAALLGGFYALRYWFLAFGPGATEPRESSPVAVRASIGFLALASLALGALWIGPINRAAARLVPGDVVPIPALELMAGLSSLAVAAVLVVTLRRRNRLVQGVLTPIAAIATDWFGIASAARRLIVTPAIAISRFLAALDDRVIDAGIRASVRIAAGTSSLLRRRTELSIDGIVAGIGIATLRTASGTRVADDQGVDRAAESIAGGLGRAGKMLRKLQTGLSHHYYVGVAVGVVALIAALAGGTS